MDQPLPEKNPFFSLIATVVITALIVLLVKQFVLTPINVKGMSMEPTYTDRDVILVDRISTGYGRFQHVVFKSPYTADEWYIKRLIGLPGDVIEMRDDVLYINGQAYDEPYVKRADKQLYLRTTEDFAPVTVPDNKYFVLGDNRIKSQDSRHFGFIDSDIVVGKSLATIYPLSHLQWAQ